MDFAFKQLVVWQKAMELVRVVYRLSKLFPAEERYALTDQLRRAVVSIPSNIAEGNGRAGNKDYAHFLAIARGSLYETLTQLQIARDLGYIPDGVKNPGEGGQPTSTASAMEEIDSLSFEIASMLGAMLKKYGAISNSTFN